MSTTVAGPADAARGLAPGPGGAIRTTVRRVLAVAALVLASLLVFVLLPGRNAPAVTGRPYMLPAVPTVHSSHPHGPNSPVPGG
jgi:hypothetical protein